MVNADRASIDLDNQSWYCPDVSAGPTRRLLIRTVFWANELLMYVDAVPATRGSA